MPWPQAMQVWHCGQPAQLSDQVHLLRLSHLFGTTACPQPAACLSHQPAHAVEAV